MTFAPASNAHVNADQLLTANAMETTEVNYLARRDQAKAPRGSGPLPGRRGRRGHAFLTQPGLVPQPQDA